MFNFLNTTDPKKNQLRLVLLLIGVLLLGIIVGNAGRPQAQTVTNTETKTVTQDKTPQSCLDYIEYADQGFGYAEESMGYAADAMAAISEYDTAGITKATADLKSMKPKLDALAPKIQQAKADCQASK